MKSISRIIMPVRWWDPRNVGWWVLALLGIGGLVWAVIELAPAMAMFPAAAVVGIVLSVPFALIWWFGLRSMQITTRIGTPAQVWAILWGGGAAAGIYALPANGAIMDSLGRGVDVYFASDWGAAIAAPITEETGKLLGVVAVVLAARSWLRTPMDGLLIGGFVGLGFCLTENYLYGFNITYMNFGESPAISTLVIFILRAGIFFPISHAIFTGFAGAALGFFFARPAARRPLFGVVAILFAYGTHFLWNSPLLQNWLLRFAVVGVVPLLMWLIVHLARRAEFSWYLAAGGPAVSASGVDPAYVHAVKPTLVQRLKYRSQVARTYGPAARKDQVVLEGILVDLADASDARDAEGVQALEARLRDHLAPKAASEAVAQPVQATVAQAPVAQAPVAATPVAQAPAAQAQTTQVPAHEGAPVDPAWAEYQRQYEQYLRDKAAYDAYMAQWAEYEKQYREYVEQMAAYRAAVAAAEQGGSQQSEPQQSAEPAPTPEPEAAPQPAPPSADSRDAAAPSDGEPRNPWAPPGV